MELSSVHAPLDRGSSPGICLSLGLNHLAQEPENRTVDKAPLFVDVLRWHTATLTNRSNYNDIWSHGGETFELGQPFSGERLNSTYTFPK